MGIGKKLARLRAGASRCHRPLQGTSPADLFGLSGQVAIVTGGGSGIGLATAKCACRRRRARRHPRPDPAARRRGRVPGRRARLLLRAGRRRPTKPRSRRAFEAVLSRRAARHPRQQCRPRHSPGGGRPYALDLRPGPRASTSSALFSCARVAARAMIARGEGGSIVNLASIMGLSGGGLYPNVSYQTSKGAIVNMTRALAVEWAPHAHPRQRSRSDLCAHPLHRAAAGPARAGAPHRGDDASRPPRRARGGRRRHPVPGRAGSGDGDGAHAWRWMGASWRSSGRGFRSSPGSAVCPERSRLDDLLQLRESSKTPSPSCSEFRQALSGIGSGAVPHRNQAHRPCSGLWRLTWDVRSSSSLRISEVAAWPGYREMFEPPTLHGR